MTLVRTLGLIVLFAACEATVAGSGGEGSPDASQNGSPDGSSPSIDASVPIADAAPTGCTKRSVYLSFEGETLNKGATSDATMNRAQWIGVTTAFVPKYRANATDRDTLKATIETRIRNALSQFPITVVSGTRPPPPYIMIVFGGTANDVGTQYTYATNYHDCGDATANDVAWVSDIVPFDKVDDYAIGAIGWGLGLGGTNAQNDCMCGWDNGCDQLDSQCTLSTSILASPTCAGAPNPQNEVATFQQAFCY